MAKQSLETCLAFVFAEEGGYTDDPLDPGGATNLGITLKELSVWRHTAVTKADVRALQRDEAAAIYVANYWNVVRDPDMPAGLDLMLFDAAVNTGTVRAARMLQQVVGVPADGAIGAQTLEAVAREPVQTMIDQFAGERENLYRTLPTFPHFGAGWLARVQRARIHAVQLAGLAGGQVGA